VSRWASTPPQQAEVLPPQGFGKQRQQQVKASATSPSCLEQAFTVCTLKTQNEKVVYHRTLTFAVACPAARQEMTR
jgi:hypothetical protein